MSDQHPIWGAHPQPPEPPQPQPEPQQGPPSLPEPWRPPPRSLISAIIALVVLIVIVLAARGQGGASGGSSGTPHQVRYEVTGDSAGMTASMTFQDAGANTAQQNGEALPWSYRLTASPGAFLDVSAQNQGDSGSITCTIYVDGQVVQTSTSSGGYAICQASGKL